MKEVKICSKCNIEQPSENFVQNRFVCKKCRKIHMQNYYEKNKEHIKSHQLSYYDNNKEKVRERYDKEKQKELNQKYYQENKDKINKRKRKHEKDKLKNNDLYKLSYGIRRNINLSIKGRGYTKKSKTTEILGCSFIEFKEHIEKQFESWMTWENKGLYNGELNYGWDIDHKIPLSKAMTEEDVIKLNHYTNLQPLCSNFNRDIKRGNV